MDWIEHEHERWKYEQRRSETSRQRDFQNRQELDRMIAEANIKANQELARLNQIRRQLNRKWSRFFAVMCVVYIIVTVFHFLAGNWIIGSVWAVCTVMLAVFTRIAWKKART